MNTSSTRTEGRRSVLLRMARDQARAERIKALKDANPEITWDEIAAYVGVSTRAAGAWGASGGIAPQNARKLAEFFSVDYEALYRGPASESPDLMSALQAPSSSPSQLSALREEVQELHAKIDELIAHAAAQTLAEQAREAPPGAHTSRASAG